MHSAALRGYFSLLLAGLLLTAWLPSALASAGGGCRCYEARAALALRDVPQESCSASFSHAPDLPGAKPLSLSLPLSSDLPERTCASMGCFTGQCLSYPIPALLSPESLSPSPVYVLRIFPLRDGSPLPSAKDPFFRPPE
ncbi:MAG: hypothetical protein LBQ63_00475 [Deltaproteobacteria bacterium]|jgi:hypothetical protein|nr:hypothetical protein [Deltaproteobacteria bacterium]